MKAPALINFLDETLFIQGEVSFHTAGKLIKQMESLTLKDFRKIDCSGMTHVDSTAVGLLLYLLQGRELVLQGVNQSLQSLLNLYDVTAFFNATQR